MPSKLTNPFDKEENLKPFFEGDQRYVELRDKGLDMFITKNSPNRVRAGFWSFIRGHAIASVAILAFVVGTLGVTAAEVLAPDVYKPSTFLSTPTEQPEDDSDATPDVYTASVDDFEFEYNADQGILTTQGTIELPSPCFDVLSSELIPTSNSQGIIYNLVLETGDKSSLDGEEIACIQVIVETEIEQTFDIRFKDSELDRFDSLFAVRILQSNIVQPDSVPTPEPLVSDDVFVVTVIEDCDLAIRHPASVLLNDGISEIATVQNRDTYSTSFDNEAGISLGINYTCVQDPDIGINEFAESRFEESDFEITIISSEEFCQQVPFNSFSCDLLTDTILEVASDSVTEYVFELNDVLYAFEVTIGEPEIEAITIQFDSLAPSKNTGTFVDSSTDTVITPIPELIVTPAPITQPENFFEDLTPQSHVSTTSLCQDSSIGVSYERDYALYSRSPNEVFIEFTKARHIYGFELFSQRDINSHGFEIICYEKTDEISDTESFLSEYQNIGLGVFDGSIRDVEPDELAKWFHEDSLSKISSAQFIELGGISEFADKPSVLAVVEYGDYLISIDYKPVSNTPIHSNADPEDIQIYFE